MNLEISLLCKLLIQNLIDHLTMIHIIYASTDWPCHALCILHKIPAMFNVICFISVSFSEYVIYFVVDLKIQ